jgi:hypothetical protein
MLLALPGGGAAAVAVAQESEPAAVRWWIARANRAAWIADGRERQIMTEAFGEEED